MLEDGGIVWESIRRRTPGAVRLSSLYVTDRQVGEHVHTSRLLYHPEPRCAHRIRTPDAWFDK